VIVGKFYVGDFEVYLFPNSNYIVLQIFVELCNTFYANTFVFTFLHFIHLYSWYNIMTKNVTNSNLVLVVNVDG
jgi:hypothetical protein